MNSVTEDVPVKLDQTRAAASGDNSIKEHHSGDEIQSKPNGTPGRINKFLAASL